MALVQGLKSRYSDMLIGIDPVVDEWFLMKSPVPVLSILSLYLFFVLKWGPKWMDKRKPFELKNLLIAYNAYQVCFSIWLCILVCFLKFQFI